jgi:hypothetical protein
MYAHHETTRIIYLSNGKIIQPQRIPSGRAIEPVMQSARPKKINVPKSGTVKRFARGAMNETWVKVIAKMGSVAI